MPSGMTDDQLRAYYHQVYDGPAPSGQEGALMSFATMISFGAIVGAGPGGIQGTLDAAFGSNVATIGTITAGQLADQGAFVELVSNTSAMQTYDAVVAASELASAEAVTLTEEDLAAAGSWEDYFSSGTVDAPPLGGAPASGWPLIIDEDLE
jgi:hypothetical protein